MPWRRIVCLLLIVGGFSVPVLGMLQYTTFHYCDRYNYLVSGAAWLAVAVPAELLMRRLPGGRPVCQRHSGACVHGFLGADLELHPALGVLRFSVRLPD